MLSISQLFHSCWTVSPLGLCLLQANSDSTLVTQVALYSLIPFVLTFSFVIFIFYRQNREAQIRKQHSELEMRALRAQMNPHFIFNCLNSIYNSIKKNQTEEAGDYLLKFAFLTRRILENSSQQWIALEEEIEMLEAYLSLEKLRFNNKFDYRFEIANDVDIEKISVPMLLIQPFIENCIWHGFSSVEADGLINIKIHSQDGQLFYEVSDNGKLEHSNTEQISMAGKKVSFGTQIVSEQLKTIEKLEKKSAGFTVNEIMGVNGEYAGRSVHVFLPLKTL